jgi:hypothetical protein
VKIQHLRVRVLTDFFETFFSHTFQWIASSRRTVWALAKIFPTHILSTMGYLLVVVQDLHRLFFFARYLLPAGEDMFGQIKQFSHISAVNLVEVGLIWKSTSSYIENCFQKFVRLKIDWNFLLTKSVNFCEKISLKKKMQLEIFGIQSPQITGEAKGYFCKNIRAPSSEILSKYALFPIR